MENRSESTNNLSVLGSYRIAAAHHKEGKRPQCESRAAGSSLLSHLKYENLVLIVGRHKKLP